MDEAVKKQLLLTTLKNYTRWRNAGSPRGYVAYDPLNAAVTELSEDRYSFSIQITDSPVGDTWWMGEFRTVDGGADVELVREYFLRH